MSEPTPGTESVLRDWRQTALDKLQYDAAIFVGDKLLSMTNDRDDALWLAKVQFMAGNYVHAKSLVDIYDLDNSDSFCLYLAAHCMVKEGRFGDALLLLGKQNPMDLVPVSAKRCLEQGEDETELKPSEDEVQQTDAQETEDKGDDVTDREVKVADRRNKAAMCYLRGICFAQEGSFSLAKECYKTAVLIDVQCFEALDELAKNSLMSPAEEAEFLTALDVSFLQADGLGAEQVNYIKTMYDTLLSQDRDLGTFKAAVHGLTNHFGLTLDADTRLACAESFYSKCEFAEALSITESLVAEKADRFAPYPLYFACLFELKQTKSLFLVARRLSDVHPDQPYTFLAIGTYYLAMKNTVEARRYFIKTTIMDVVCGPAWIGLGHTYAMAGQHENAISAYDTAARMFAGKHLPQVFLGMQHHIIHQYATAELFFRAANKFCNTDDPLLLHEMGTVLYHQGRLTEALRAFRDTLRVIEDRDCDPLAWLGTRTNIAHTLRRLRQYSEALDEFNAVLRLGGKDANISCAKGLVYLNMNQPDDAIYELYEALSMLPGDPKATELLKVAIAEASEAREQVVGRDGPAE